MVMRTGDAAQSSPEVAAFRSVLTLLQSARARTTGINAATAEVQELK